MRPEVSNGSRIPACYGWRDMRCHVRKFRDAKIRRLAKLIQGSSLTSPAAMSLHPVKHGSCLRTATACLPSEMERKTNYFRKHLSFSFAKASKAESCFVTTRTGKSTRLSTVETTKTLSGGGSLTNSL